MIPTDFRDEKGGVTMCFRNSMLFYPKALHNAHLRHIFVERLKCRVEYAHGSPTAAFEAVAAGQRNIG
jgi:hypothetical protein